MKTNDAQALSLAYKIVTRLKGWNQKQLASALGLNHRTMRRIRLGEDIKDCTCEYALGAMYDLIEEAYTDDLKQGGDNAVLFLKMMHELLRAILGRRKGNA